MNYFAAIAALVSVVPLIAALGIDTPNNVVQCQPQLLTFDGSPPFFVSIIPGGQPSASPLEEFPRQDAKSLTWVVDIASGTPVTFEVKDASGGTAYTDKVTILNSDDASCLKSGGATSSPSPDANNVPPSTSVGGTAKTPQGPGPAPTSSAANHPAANAPPQQTTSVVTTTVRPVGGIQAVSTSTSSPLAAATAVSSGASSLFAFSNFGMASAVTLFVALFL